MFEIARSHSISSHRIEVYAVAFSAKCLAVDARANRYRSLHRTNPSGAGATTELTEPIEANHIGDRNVKGALHFPRATLQVALGLIPILTAEPMQDRRFSQIMK